MWGDPSGQPEPGSQEWQCGAMVKITFRDEWTGLSNGWVGLGSERQANELRPFHLDFPIGR